jgi:hypothetical protein
MSPEGMPNCEEGSTNADWIRFGSKKTDPVS